MIALRAIIQPYFLLKAVTLPLLSVESGIARIDLQSAGVRALDRRKVSHRCESRRVGVELRTDVGVLL
jgi:hypothetical protein